MKAKTRQRADNILKNRQIFWLVPLLFLSLAAGEGLAATEKKEEKPAAEAQTPPVRGLGSYLSGRWARNTGDIDSALNYLQRVYEQDPGNLSVAAQLQNALLQQGKIDEAIAIAEKVSKSNKDDTITNLLLSLKYVKAGDYASADRVLDSAAENASGQLWLPLIVGWVDVGKKTLKKPITIESLSANVGRAASVVNYHLALINSAAGFTAAAADNFKLAIDDVQTPPARVMQALLHFYDTHDSPVVLKELVDDYRKNRPDEKIDVKMLGLESVSDGVAEVLFTMGSVMLAGDLTQDAVVYFHLALYMKPEFSLATLALGDSYSDVQQYAKANEVYAKLPVGNKLYATAQMHRAVNFDRLGKTTLALEQLEAIAAKSPTQPDAWITRGDILRQHTRYPEAAEAYTQALARVTDAPARQWPLYFARGAIYERQGKWREAEKDLQHSLKINPNQPDVLNYLAYGWIDRGEHLEEATNMLSKAVQMRPNDPQILDSMGWALYKQAKYSEAVKYLEKSVSLLPADATVNAHLGDAYWRVGRKHEARFQWERALTFEPEVALAEELQKKLKQGLPAAPKVKVAETVPVKNSL